MKTTIINTQDELKALLDDSDYLRMCMAHLKRRTWRTITLVQYPDTGIIAEIKVENEGPIHG